MNRIYLRPHYINYTLLLADPLYVNNIIIATTVRTAAPRSIWEPKIACKMIWLCDRIPFLERISISAHIRADGLNISLGIALK